MGVAKGRERGNSVGKILQGKERRYPVLAVAGDV